jgi:hypothetical protein
MPAETASRPSALEKCRKHCDGDDASSYFVWATSLLVVIFKLVSDCDCDGERRGRKEPRPIVTDQHNLPSKFPLDVLASVFSYLSPQVAVQMRKVNRKWNGVVTLQCVPWTIVTDGFTGVCPNFTNFIDGLPTEMFRTPSGSVGGQSIKETNFVTDAIAFRFGFSPPTKLLMECIERMQKLERIQMPTNIGGVTSHPFEHDEGLYGGQCIERLIASRRCTDITHLAVTHVPCILSVCRFRLLTSLLISFGIMNAGQSIVAVQSIIQTVSEDALVLPHLQHLGLHDYLNFNGPLAVDTIVSMLEKRPTLITLSLTGMSFRPSDIKKLTHPMCGLRYLAFDAACMVGGVDVEFDVSEILLDGSPISLLVLCLWPITPVIRGFLTSGVYGFEPLRVRHVDIAGQYAYYAYPFRRLGAVDVVWGLTGGALFSE